MFAFALNKNGYPVIYTAIRSQAGIVMEARLDMEKRDQFIGVIDFYEENSQAKLDPIHMSRKDLEELVQGYSKFIYEDLKKHAIRIPREKGHSVKDGFSASISITNINKHTEGLLRSLVTRTVLTIDGYHKEPFAKTFVRFPSVSTILASEYLDDHRKTILLKIHTCNVHAANKLLRLRGEKFISDAHSAINFIRLVFTAVWIILDMYLLVSKNTSILSTLLSLISPNTFSNSTDSATLLFFIIVILDLLGVPALLLWTLPKVLIRIIQYQLNRYFRQEAREEESR